MAWSMAGDPSSWSSSFLHFTGLAEMLENDAASVLNALQLLQGEKKNISSFLFSLFLWWKLLDYILGVWEVP